MKYLISLFLVSVLFFSCEKPKNKTKMYVYKKNIYKHLDSMLLEKYPLYKQNDLVLSQATKELNNFMDTITTLNHFQHLKFNVLTVRKNPKHKNSIVHLYTTGDIGIDIIGIVSDSFAMIINQDNLYFVEGKVIGQLNDNLTRFYVNQLYNYSRVIIETGYSYKFNMGVILCDVTKLTQYIHE